MNVFVQGQKEEWTDSLQQICKKKQIDIITGEFLNQEADFLITDSPLHKRKDIPFLVISEKNNEESILESFRQGAEDYMIMPVSPKIAAARIESILKRYGYLTNDIPFTPNEYRIVSFLMRHPCHVLSREQLLDGAFFHDYEGIDRNVDNYIKDIRKKMKAAGESGQIQTVYGAGYRYVPGR